MAGSKAHLNGSEKTESRVSRPLNPPRWKLTQYTALVAATYTSETGVTEARYSLNHMDIASRRMVPTLLGVGDSPCAHRLCQLVMGMSLAEGHLANDGPDPTGDDTHLTTGGVELPLF